MDNLYSLLFFVLVFLAVAGLIEGVFLAWNAYQGPEARRIERRLQAMSSTAEHVSSPLLRKRQLSGVPAIDRLLQAIPRLQLLDRFLLQAGSSMNVAMLLGLSAVLAAGGAALGRALPLPAWFALLAAAIGAVIPFVCLLRERSKRIHAIDEQLPDALDLMARAMQARHAFTSALHMVGVEGPQPIAQEFRTAFDEINFGISTQDALVNLASRTSSSDLRYFVVAVLVQRESGGNLAELLMTIARLVRDRSRLKGTVRVLSAEGRLSAWILSILPFALAGVISLIAREFMSILWTDPVGIRLSAAAVLLMLVGIFWLSRIISLRT